MVSGWAKPSPFGAPNAVASLSGTAAPLLAGFSVTMATLVLQAPEKFRFAGATLLLLTSAIILLLTCVQCGFWARHYFASPDEAAPWFPDYESNLERREKVQEEQRGNYGSYRLWSNLARLTYAMGIVCVYSALAASIAPTDDSHDFRFKSAATLLLVLAAVGEIAWSLMAWRRQLRVYIRKVRRRLRPETRNG